MDIGNHFFFISFFFIYRFFLSLSLSIPRKLDRCANLCHPPVAEK
jgi:hypothetical protein